MELILVAVTSFLFTVAAIPFVIRLAKKYGLVDDPKLRPHPAHVQMRIIPRAGGLAMYIGIVATCLFFLPLDQKILGVLAAITILLIMGLLDDKLITFSPYYRLILLFMAAIIAVWSGIGISFISNPLAGLAFLPTGLNNSIIRLDQIILPYNFFGPHTIIVLADIFALIWIVTMTQVINWAKGVDGQMPGIILITSLVLGIISLKFYFQGDISQLNNAKIALLIAGTSAGFLVFNWYPSKILPGFSGSTILAFMLAVLAILSTAKVATAILVLAVPMIDFVYTFWRRIFSGRSPVWNDRGHLHHKLLDLGWSHQKISLFYILGSAMFGIIALFADTAGKIFVIITVAAIFLGFIIWLNSLGDLSKPHGRNNG